MSPPRRLRASRSAWDFLTPDGFAWVLAFVCGALAVAITAAYVAKEIR